VSAVKRNNVKVRGQGQRAMMFAHGFGCDQHMWRLVAPAFEPDFQTVLFDNVGAGGSDLDAYDAAKYGSLKGYADDWIGTWPVSSRLGRAFGERNDRCACIDQCA
jgi:sigma-B regulation protein RsbQ